MNLGQPYSNRWQAWTRRLTLSAAFLAGSLSMAQGQTGAQARPAWMDAPPASTGIAVGKKIPPFRASDQNGRVQDFNSIRGPKGAVILFSRSADW